MCVHACDSASDGIHANAFSLDITGTLLALKGCKYHLQIKLVALVTHQSTSIYFMSLFTPILKRVPSYLMFRPML